MWKTFFKSLPFSTSLPQLQLFSMQKNGLIPVHGYIAAAAGGARDLMSRSVATGGNEGACAVCRSQRKRCDPDKCHLRRYLPAEKMEDFAFIHRIFGVANLNKMFAAAQNKQRLVDTLAWEARRRRENRDDGCFADVERLCEEVIRLRKLIGGCPHCSAAMPLPLLLTPDVPLREDLRSRYTESCSAHVPYLFADDGGGAGAGDHGGLHYQIMVQPSHMISHGQLNEATMTGINGYLHALTNREQSGSNEFEQGRAWCSLKYNMGSQNVLAAMKR